MAACIIDSRSLEIKPNSQFQTYIKPTDWNKVEAEALEINKIEKAIVEEKGLSQKEAWTAFTSYVNKYNKKKNFWGAPIAAGHNILAYDMVIVERMCKLYGPTDNKTGEPNLFHGRDKIDLLHMAFLWFETNKDLANYKLDTIRKYFGISREGAHNAVKDVEDTAMLISRFLKFHRNIASTAKFKGAFEEKKV